MTKSHVVAFLLAVGAAAIVSAAEVKPINQWKGSADDERQAVGAPVCIVSQKALAKLWTDWKLAGEAPKADFVKNLVVLTTTRGSQLNLILRLDDKGDLQVHGMSTRDLRPGFRYVIGEVSKEGITTVNGKPLPTE